MIIDTHSHVYLEEFDSDQAKIKASAEKEGVESILMPAIDSATHGRMLELEGVNPTFYRSMMGLHPCSVKENYREELELVNRHFTNRKFVAVGEIGLDFYWDRSYTDQQYEVFRQQLAWSKDLGLPVSIHSRNATDECIQVVKEMQDGKLKGVFHCFSGNLEQAKQIIDLGLYLGIGGVVTFKNSGLDKVMQEIDLDHIVLETDAPYLAPVPFRGKRNEPSYLKYVIEKLTGIKNCDPSDIKHKTTSNARQIFQL